MVLSCFLAPHTHITLRYLALLTLHKLEKYVILYFRPMVWQKLGRYGTSFYHAIFDLSLIKDTTDYSAQRHDTHPDKGA